MISQERDHYRLSFILYNCFVFLWGGGGFNKNRKTHFDCKHDTFRAKKKLVPMDAQYNYL